VIPAISETFGGVDLQLGHLRTLAAVVRHGSFSQAAVHLGLTQPAVSMQIQHLEAQTGLRLLERLGRRVRPTAAGTVLLEHAERATGELERALERLHGLRGQVTGRVRLGTGSAISMYVLPPLLRALQRRSPAVELMVVTGTAAEIDEAVVGHDLDVGVVALPVHRHELAVEPFLTDELVAIGSPRRWRARGPVDAPALAAERLILDQQGAASRRLVDAWFDAQGVKPAVPLELANSEAAKVLAADALGVAIAPFYSVRREVAARRLVVRRLSPRLGYPLARVRRRDRPPGAALDAVLAALDEVRRGLERAAR
jgi:DNA-binding transcriptional LysR family regulator